MSMWIIQPKRWFSWLQNSADNFEFSAERLSENAKSIKITLLWFTHFCREILSSRFAHFFRRILETESADWVAFRMYAPAAHPRRQPKGWRSRQHPISSHWTEKMLGSNDPSGIWTQIAPGKWRQGWGATSQVVLSHSMYEPGTLICSRPRLETKLQRVRLEAELIFGATAATGGHVNFFVSCVNFYENNAKCSINLPQNYFTHFA